MRCILQVRAQEQPSRVPLSIKSLPIFCTILGQGHRPGHKLKSGVGVLKQNWWLVSQKFCLALIWISPRMYPTCGSVALSHFCKLAQTRISTSVLLDRNLYTMIYFLLISVFISIYINNTLRKHDCSMTNCIKKSLRPESFAYNKINFQKLQTKESS